MAGDVYSAPPYCGRGGWSWYTGAAGLMHRAAIESIFGLSQDAVSLSFTPCLPSHWNEAELTLRRDAKVLRFILLRTRPERAQQEAEQRQAQLLAIGQALPYPTFRSGLCYLVPLPPALPGNPP
jgi:cyclic beta-1,2-glucan synthetase